MLRNIRIFLILAPNFNFFSFSKWGCAVTTAPEHYLDVYKRQVILWQYASSLFTSSYSSKIRLALLSALYTILFLLSLLEQTGLNVVSFFVFNTVFLYMLFKLKLLLALFHSAILTAIMGISEIAVLGITSRFFPHFLLETDAELVFYTVFSKIFFFAVIYLLIHLFKGKKSNQEQYDLSLIHI